jgi:predicted Zn-dependent protease
VAEANFRICPNCGTRNKATWEFCARCGEDLTKVPRGEPVAAEAAEDAVPQASGSWLGLVGLVAVVAVMAYAASRLYRPEPPRGPDSALFRLPDAPSAAPAQPGAAPTDAESSFEEGRRMLLRGDAAGAVVALARAVAEAPDNAYYRNMYAKALLASGANGVETIRQFEEAVRLDARNTEYLRDLARGHDRLGHTEEAAQAYMRVLSALPSDAAALRDLSGLYARAGRFDAALPHLQELARVQPDDLVIQQELGLAYEKTGDKAAAAQAYRDIVDKFPAAAVTRGLLAEILIGQGKNDEAVTVLREGVERDPSAPLLHRTLGSALERTGNVTEAIREYREYARLNPDAPDAKTMAERADRLEARVARSS